MDHCDPNYLATGSYDGAIIVWNEETEQILVTLRRGSSSKSERSSPVEKLLFLKDRLAKDRVARKLRGGAVLLSSEEGIIHWWSISGHIHHMGKFSATDSVDASVLGMATSPDNAILATADTTGIVTIWDISNHCVLDTQKFQTQKPPIKHRWKAHDMAIVNIDYIDYELYSLVVTSSSDKTARLWTLDGKFVGTFGQKKRWNLKKSSTFQHPRNPWGELVEDIPPSTEGKATNNNASLQDAKRAGVTFEDELKLEDDDTVDGGKDDGTPTKEPSKLEDADNDKSIQKGNLGVKFPPILRPPGDSKRLERRRDTEPHIHDDRRRNIAERRLKWQTSKPLTVAQFQLSKDKILGETAEKSLAKRTATRQERRYRVGYINQNTTSRFGNLCSPFQALSIPDTEKVKFAATLPMSQRMQQRGMACLSETDLGKLPLHCLADIADHDTDSTTDERPRRLHSSRRKFPRRSTILPLGKVPRTSSVASGERPVTDSRSISSSVSGGRIGSTY